MQEYYDFDFLIGPVEKAAPRLLGCLLVRELDDGSRLVGRIVETEAYDQLDAASHSYRGETPRTKVMFGPAGTLYVYFTYGMHYCMNIVAGAEGYGAAVLIRALEPIEGLDTMLCNRQGRGGLALTNGPAKVCQALGIDGQWNGHDLRRPPLLLIVQSPASEPIIKTTRIGITRAAAVPWRFYLKDNPYVSKP